MFKVGKIKQISNEKVEINPSYINKCSFRDGKAIYTKINTLIFEISGDDYSFTFETDKDNEELLKIPMREVVDFKDYIFIGETFFNIYGDTNYMDPDIKIIIYRYLENRFEITIHFNTEEYNPEEEYSGIIQFSFDLDDYLNVNKES